MITNFGLDFLFLDNDFITMRIFVCLREDFCKEVAMIKCRVVIELANSRPQSTNWLSGAFFNYDVGSQVIDARTGWPGCLCVDKKPLAARRCVLLLVVCVQ